jgi:hypothetical protein
MSVNMNGAIPEKYRKKTYGRNYYSIDFELSDRLTAEQYRSQLDKNAVLPIIGILEIGNYKIPVTQKELEKLKETSIEAIHQVSMSYRLGLLK